jgi:hypothetical protein
MGRGRVPGERPTGEPAGPNLSGNAAKVENGRKPAKSSL